VLLAPVPFGIWAAGRSACVWWYGRSNVATPLRATGAGAPRLARHAGMVRIPSGRTLVGSATSNQADRQPAHEVVLDAFWIDEHPVTNEQFAEFVEQAKHVTTAERRGSSLVFDVARREWMEVDGATWKSPDGPLSTLVERERLPVVHVSWDDAASYAAWAGKRLATEAEYELAARGGLIDQCYVWGTDLPAATTPVANFWQGNFPAKDQGLDGYRGLAPVAQFPPNRFGLYDMAGNAWCWCSDWYAADYYYAGPRRNPQGAATGQARVLRGGSWMSTGGVDSELAVAARGHAPPHHTASNVGFRCASSSRPYEVAKHDGAETKSRGSRSR
jgi:formylglycine-generating enzyme required for sulfatase activity